MVEPVSAAGAAQNDEFRRNIDTTQGENSHEHKVSSRTRSSCSSSRVRRILVDNDLLDGGGDDEFSLAPRLLLRLLRLCLEPSSLELDFVVDFDNDVDELCLKQLFCDNLVSSCLRLFSKMLL